MRLPGALPQRLVPVYGHGKLSDGDTGGTAAAHALQYPIGNLTHTAHGAGVAAILPYVMQFNRPSCAPAYAELATLIGLPDGTVKSRAA